MSNIVERLRIAEKVRLARGRHSNSEISNGAYTEAADRIEQLEAALRPFVDIIKDERQVFGDDYPVAINSSTVPKPFVDAAIAALGK